MEEKNIENIAEMICELTRCCHQKEDYFATTFNLSPTEVRFLKLYNNKTIYTIKELTVLLELTPGRISHILTSLESKKLIERIKNENDKRNVFVKLLPKANLFIKNLKENYISLHKELIENLSNEEIEKISSSLKILIENFRKWELKNLNNL